MSRAGLSKRASKQRVPFDIATAQAKLSVSEFPMPDFRQDPDAYAALPNNQVALPHMQNTLDMLTFDEDSMGSQVKEARFRRAWFSPLCQELVGWFVWHTLSSQFQRDAEREHFLFGQIAVVYGQIHTSDMRPAVKDELTWHLPDAMARAAIKIMREAFPRSNARRTS